MSLTLSGAKLGTTSNQYIDAKIEWSVVGDIKTNASKVTASLMYKRNNTGFTTQGTGSFSITIDGTKYTSNKYITITENEWVTAITASKTVTHDSNGKKTLSISASGSIPDTTLTSTSVSFSEALYTIPRASTLDSLTGSNAYFNGAMTYRYTPKSSSFYNRCNISLNLDGEYIAVKTINLGKKSASQQTATVTLSESELSTVYKKLPETTKGTLRFTLRTYSDAEYSKQIGDAVYKEITLTITDDTTTQPTATMTLSPVSSLPSPFSSFYIKGRTKVDANFTNGEGKYGAYIVSYKMSVDGKSYGSPYTSGYITSSGSVTVKGTVTDSRGRSRTYTQKITVVPYSKPKILPASGESEIICARCDADGNISESGTYLKIKAKRSYSPLVSGEEQKNFCKIRYRYQKDGGSYSSWNTILAADSLGSNEVSTGALLGGALSVQSSYLVQIQAIDDVGESGETTIVVPTDRVYWHRAGSIRSYGFGEYVDDPNTFSVADDIAAIFKGGFRAIEIPEHTDFDTLTKPNLYYGRYTYTPNYVNCPITVEATFSLEVIPMGKDGQMLQRVTRCSDEATVYERQYYSHEWHEWECVNPPMLAGVEYRTKERYFGKPVYTKVVNFGTLPNTAYKLVAHGAEASQVIRCVGQMSDGNSLPFHFSETNWVEIYAGKESIVILAGNDKTNRTAYAQIWYVKD